jgi:hypothetical protein
MVQAEEIASTAGEAAPPETSSTRQSRKLNEIIDSQLKALRIHHQAVLDSEGVEAIHKMRVTTRRLQASLDLLEREMNVRKLKKRLHRERGRKPGPEAPATARTGKGDSTQAARAACSKAQKVPRRNQRRYHIAGSGIKHPKAGIGVRKFKGL